MRAMVGKLGLALGVVLAVMGCSKQGAVDPGPDEFLVLPGKPLQAPASYNTLPEPTPGSSNITDPTPVSDAISALGGRRSG